jgi:hypothetical protein
LITASADEDSNISEEDAGVAEDELATTEEDEEIGLTAEDELATTEEDDSKTADEDDDFLLGIEVEVPGCWKYRTPSFASGIPSISETSAESVNSSSDSFSRSTMELTSCV